MGALADLAGVQALPSPAQPVTSPAVNGGSALAALAASGSSPSAATQDSAVGPTVPRPASESVSPGGFFSNIVGGISSAVRGISTLIGSGVHDVAKATAEAIPGHQAIEEDPYKLATVARTALPGAWVPGPDLGGKYGAIVQDFITRYGPLVEALNPSDNVGFAEGLRKFGEQLYEQPVSFALDALTVGGAAAGAFKGVEKLAAVRNVASKIAAGGLEGSELRGLYAAAKAEQVAGRSGLALKVLGSGEGYKTLSMTASAVEKTLPLSSNPVTRVLQRGAYWLTEEPLTKATERLSQIGEGASQEALIGALQAKKAAELGLTRVQRPLWSHLAEQRAVGMLAGMRKAGLSQLTREGLATLNDIWDARKGVDKAAGFEYLHGSLREGIIDVTKPLDFNPPEIPSLNDAPVLPQASLVQPDERIGYFKSLQDSFGNRVSGADFQTPHGGAVGDRARYEIQVGSMAQAPQVLQQAADALGGSIRGSLNYMNDEGSWFGYHGFIDLPDGKVIEVSAATPELFTAQSAASKILSRRDEALNESARLAAEAENAGSPAEALTLRNQAAAQAKEAEALDTYAKSMFELPLRKHISETAGVEYNASLRAADEHRLWTFNYVTDRAMQNGLTGEIIMNRLYGPQRLASFDLDMAKMKDALVTLAKGAKTWDEVLPNILDAFQNIPEDLVRSALDSLPTSNPVKAAKTLASRIETKMRESVINGDWPGYGWREMHATRMAQGLNTPQYIHHFQISELRPSQLISRTSFRVRDPSSVANKWQGFAMEGGQLVTDPIEASRRVFGQIARHEANVEFLDKVLNQYARRVSPEELLHEKIVGTGPEMYVNPTGAKASINVRKLIEAETQANLLKGMTVENASATALRDLMPKLQQSILESSTGELFAVPRHVAKQIEFALRQSLGWKGQVFWDSPIGVWRAAVLSFSPRWIVNNVIGNIVFSTLKDPASLRYAIRQLSGKQKALLEYMIGKDKLADIEGGYMSTFRAYDNPVPEEALSQAPGVAKAVSRVRSNRVTGYLRSVSNAVRQFNSYIEEAWRRGVYLSSLEKQNMAGFFRGFAKSDVLMQRIAREGIDEATHAAALRSVADTLGNFTNLGPVESDYIRRYVAPFYGFYRHVAKFTAKLPFENPLKLRVLQLIDQTDAQFYKYAPEWLQGAVPVGAIGTGTSLFLNFQNSNPLSSIMQIGGGPLSPVNPALKILIERATGRQTFGSQKEFTDPNIFEASNGMKWQVTRNENGQIVAVYPVTGRVLPSWFQHIASQFPEYSLLQKAYNAMIGPGAGAQHSGTGTVMLNRLGQPAYPAPWYTPFLNYAGVPLYPYDYNAGKYKYLESQLQALASG